jgi:phenylacetate-CoA ligase
MKADGRRAALQAGRFIKEEGRMPIWERDKECIEREELRQLQFERLQATLNRVQRNVAFYRRRFREVGFSAEEDIGDVSDLARLPFTTSEDISSCYPYEMFAVPLREVVRIHSSTGTMRNPQVVGYTRQDLAAWSQSVARILSAAGVTRDDVIQITFAYGLMTGGLGIQYGAERLGASVLPTAVGRTDRQISIMRDYRTTVLAATPAYARVVAARLEQQGIDPKQLSLRCVLCAGEPLTEAERSELEARLFVKVFDTYVNSEVMGPGIAGECLEERHGMHLQEDHFLAEVIDPHSGAVLPPGAEGELVITTLTKEAFPVVRYRTGDRCRLIAAPCPCGRSFQRIGRIHGRCDGAVIVKGVRILPERIGEILASVRGAQPLYQVIATRHGLRECLEIWVEVTDAFFSDIIRDHSGFADAMRERVANVIGITPHVKLVEPGSLLRQEGTLPLFVDRR